MLVHVMKKQKEIAGYLSEALVTSHLYIEYAGSRNARSSHHNNYLSR